MHNFGRVLRLALAYRLTLAASVVCALGVAVFWLTNLSVIYPFVTVFFEGKSLQQWVDVKIEQAQRTAQQLQVQIEECQRRLPRLPPEDQPAVRSELSMAQARWTAEQKAEQTYLWLKPYIDRYLPTNPFSTLALVTGMLLVGTILKECLLITNTVLVARVSQLATFDLRKAFYRRTLRMDLATFGDEGTSDLMSRFTFDTEQVAAGLDALFGKFVREPLKMAACLIGAAWFCWRLLLLSLVIAPLAALAVRWLSKMLKRANRRAMEEMAQLYGILEETFRGIKIVKAFTMEPHERRRFHTGSKKYFQRAMRIVKYDSLARPMTEVMGILTLCLALLAGMWLVLSGEIYLLGIKMADRPIDAAALMAFYGCLAGMADPMRKLSEIFARLQRAAAACDRIYDRLDRQPQVREPSRPISLGRHHRDLVFDGVQFAYRPDQPVLKDVHLTIPCGQTVAIVGPNGCGKSTLVNLIPRFADPTGGVIRIDGVPIQQVRIRELRGQIGLVTQETLLFDDTILNNIRYGSPQATPEQVIAAAKQAHAHRFIEKELPEGYDTVVGTLGGRLSGGQRQRIALARAILRDPAILLLDEATSQIDLESEHAIQQALEQFTRNRTTVIITHRMAVLALADQIVVMEAGRILDVGRHEELLGRCALYRRLHQIQFEPLAA